MPLHAQMATHEQRRNNSDKMLIAATPEESCAQTPGSAALLKSSSTRADVSGRIASIRTPSLPSTSTRGIGLI